MPGRIRPDEENNDDYYTQYDHGRRHRSQPPKKNRVKEEDRPQRPKFAKDDSYYNPRDKYYLSGDDEPDFHPYFASRKDDLAPTRREESPPRHRRESRARESHSRYESPARYESPTRYESPPRRREASPPRRRQTSPSQDRRRTKSHTRSHSSEDRHLAQRYADEEQERASRYSGAASTAGSSRHRSSTTVPPPRSDHHSHDDYDHRPSRRDTTSSRHRYPPSSSKAHGGPKRSSTQPASSHRERGSSSRSPSESESKSPRTHRQHQQDLFMSAGRAALEAGAMAALKLHDDPSPWIGVKGTKVITTALGAAMVDTFMEQRKPEMKGGMVHGVAKSVATFALGNLVTKPAAKHGLGGRHVQKGMK